MGLYRAFCLTTRSRFWSHAQPMLHFRGTSETVINFIKNIYYPYCLDIHTCTKGRMTLLGCSGPKWILCAPLFFSCSGLGAEYDLNSARLGYCPPTYDYAALA